MEGKHVRKNCQPDWSRMVSRILCPARSGDGFYFREVGVMNLGLLFTWLGDQFTARELYEYYLLSRVVAVKFSRHQQI